MFRACLTVAIAAGVAASPAYADVLEVGPAGATWIAGGPVSPSASTQADLGFADAGSLVQRTAEAGVPAQWQPRVAQLAAKYDISPRLLEALVWQESRWRPGAVSSAGARGLTQLMPGTARQMGVNPDDPHANLEGGARYLRMQLDTFNGDVAMALAAYNAGPARVARKGGVPAIRETQNYVASILARLSRPVRN